MIDIKLLDKKADFQGYSFIEGFPGIGLVGPMAINYMIDKLDMDYCGYLDSDKFPPLIAIHDSIPMPPIRIYCSKKYKLVTIFAEFQIPMDLIYELSAKLNEFIKENKISRIFSVNGMPYKDDSQDATALKDPNVAFGMVSKKNLISELKKYNISPVNEGVATGISAMMMTKALNDNIDDITLLIPVNPNLIDPKYAESAIKYINQLVGLDINTDELEKESKEVEAKIKDLLKKNKDTHQTYKNSYNDSGLSMYA
ncbi:ATP-grasp superfamily enzyme [Candidatus Mancarchaeum acidiphilum]|uniref:ATP-grasp superfamily enzyme n=1 Tax=Candidatus Mancarchaeum acidiphilum TaxID=1920749 RepID=A0A218NNR8_9ARCH|nr:PAC2 family protein [Candidatus Mancarchaeum acidiphilum]ASI14115.1 ATP-grasp superfamily enzyme [Candidatus Mancarchaeum acidiphilum]